MSSKNKKISSVIALAPDDDKVDEIIREAQARFGHVLKLIRIGDSLDDNQNETDNKKKGET